MGQVADFVYEEGEKHFQDLSITDNFMFAKVMHNEHLCRKFLEMVFKIKICRVVYIGDEKTIRNRANAKSVRLDVYLSDEKGTVYNIEMQTSDTYNLPKRSRYYQGMIDLNLLQPGDEYNQLNTSYIVFVCTFDLFRKGRHIYTFENRCVEDLELVLPDKSVKVFINTKGTMKDIDDELQELMDFFNGKQAQSGIAKEFCREVEKIKQRQDWQVEYMTMMELEREKYREGFGEGLKQGIINTIATSMEYGAAEEQVIAKAAERFHVELAAVQEIWDKRS